MDGKLGGYLASGGALHIPLTYEAGGQFPEGVAPVRLDGKWGFIDKHGAFVVKPEYDAANSSYQRRMGCKRDGLFGFCTQAGVPVKPFRFRLGVRIFRRRRGRSDNESKTGFVDRSRTVAITLKYDNAGEFSEGLAWVALADKCGYIDRQGSRCFPCDIRLAATFPKESLTSMSMM